MTSAYYYNQQQPSVGVPPVPQQRGIPGQIGINPAQGHYIQQQQQQQYRNQGMSDPNGHRKRTHSKAPRQTAPLVDDADEPSGDELDDISARDIAMARYKRNHDYLSEIFTPYNAASIVPPPLDLTQSKEELNKQIEEHKERTVRQKTTHEERIVALQKEQEQFWNLMNKLNEATTIESIDATSQELAKEMGVKIEHTPNNVKALAIPGIEDQDLIDLENERKLKESEQHQHQQQGNQIDQTLLEKDEKIKSESPNNNTSTEHQHNGNTANNNSSSNKINEDDTMDMFFDDQQQEGENTDSFFNEMVNADDDPANEFLNTE